MGKYPLRSAQISSWKPMVDAGDVLDRAGAILLLLAGAYEADSEANRLTVIAARPDDAPDWAGMNPILFRDALHGVATLITLARHLELDEADGQP